MSVFKKLLLKYKVFFVFILLFSISIIFLACSDSEPTRKAKGSFYNVVYPFHYAGYSVSRFFKNAVMSKRKIKSLTKQNELLLNENNYLKQMLNKSIYYQKEAESPANNYYDSIFAEVIGADPEKMFDILVINKGKNQGIEVDMPVTTYYNNKTVVVGKIIETSALSSKVLTFQNSDFKIAAKISRGNIHTIVEGSEKKDGYVNMIYLPKDYEMNRGDMVLTSGFSKYFPKNIEIGEVESVKESNRYDLYNEAEVKVTCQLSKIEYVSILLIKE